MKAISTMVKGASGQQKCHDALDMRFENIFYCSKSTQRQHHHVLQFRFCVYVALFKSQKKKKNAN